MIRKLFKNARIFTPVDLRMPSAGPRQGAVEHFEPGALVCENGLITAIGEQGEVLSSHDSGPFDQEMDCQKRCLIPGFVDPHTHMCFVEEREEEFAQRLDGMEYLEILRHGGGILSTVRSVRAASEEQLYTSTLRLALSALRLGTTTLEIKSGYGLDTATELKMLRVIERVARETPLDVVPTFLGAHAVPIEFKGHSDDYVNLLIEKMIPAVAEQSFAKYCDVFCEKGVFSIEQSRRILEAARQYGLGLKIHADEVHDIGGARLAAELSATSAEHLLASSEENLRLMSLRSTVGVLLPATAYSLRKPYAPARKMLELGVPLALASDCNPGSCYSESMPFIYGLAVLQMNLTVNEALVAATLNSAYAIGKAHQVGSLDVGKNADFLLLDGMSPAILAFHAGVSPVAEVYKRGERVAANP